MNYRDFLRAMDEIEPGTAAEFERDRRERQPTVGRRLRRIVAAIGSRPTGSKDVCAQPRRP